MSIESPPQGYYVRPLFSESFTVVPALLPFALPPRQARRFLRKVCTVHFVTKYRGRNQNYIILADVTCGWSICPSLWQHLVGELVADGLLLLHGLRPLVDVHREVVRRGDGAPADVFGEKHLFI